MTDLSKLLASLSPAQRKLFLRRLERRHLATMSEPTTAAPRRPDRAEVPMSVTQERLWYLYGLEPESYGYNVSTAIRLTGRLDARRLEDAFNALIQRHEMLRTTFAERPGGAVQVIAASAHMDLPIVDLQRLPSTLREDEIHRVATQELRLPFDLVRGPLLRACLLRLGQREHGLIFEQHHIVTDAVSIAVEVRDLSCFYHASSVDRPAELPELTLHFADFAVDQRRWLDSTELDSQLAYWRRQLAGLKTAELPIDHPRPSTPSLRGAKITRRGGADLARGLKSLSQQPETTLFMTVLAAFKVLLNYWTGGEDLVVGCNTANRTQAGSEDLVGFFVDVLVLRTDLSGDPTFLEVLERVREVTLAAHQHGDLPFSKLVETLQPQRDQSRNPYYQVKIDFQNTEIGLPQLGDLEVAYLDFDYGRVHSDLTLYVVDAPKGLVLTLEYSTDLFEHASMERLLTRFEMLLETLVVCPGMGLVDLVQQLRAADEEQRRVRDRSFKNIQRSKLGKVRRRALTLDMKGAVS